MTYNRDIKSFAPLPYGPLPTHLEIAAMVHRGRKLQSRAFWTKLTRLFKFNELRRDAKRADIALQAPMMWSMLDRLDIDMSRLKQTEFKTKIAAMTRRCVACAKVAACQNWFDTHGPVDAYRAFCPNASAIDSLPRAAVSH